MANNSGANYAGSFVGWAPQSGVNPVMAQTLPGGLSTQSASTGQQSAVTGSNNSGIMSSQFFGEPLGVWIGFIILLLLLKWLSERKESGYNPAYIKIGGYNVMAIGLSAGIFIILMKVIFNKFNVPGVTAFSNAL